MGDGRLPFEPGREERRGEALGPPVELAPGDPTVRVHERRSVGEAGGVGVEDVGEVPSGHEQARVLPGRDTVPMRDRIESVEALRALFPPPSRRAVAKEIHHVDELCRAWLAQCPFVAVGTTNPDGTGDVSPKGGPPGFVKVLDDRHVAWGELPGNNRLDGYRNVLRDPRVGLLCMVPGVAEMLRINGTAWISTDRQLIERTAIDGALPTVAFVVEVAEAFVHCSKAVRRSGLWDPARWPDPADVPTAAAMLLAHRGEHEGDVEAEERRLDALTRDGLWNR